METKVHGIQAEYFDELIEAINKFCKGRKVFATQTHISNGIFYAVIYYEFDEQIANEKPRILNKDNYFGKPNNSLKPEKNSIPATPNQIFSLVKYYGYSEEAAKKLSKHEAYQIIKEKKGRKK